MINRPDQAMRKYLIFPAWIILFASLAGASCNVRASVDRTTPTNVPPIISSVPAQDLASPTVTVVHTPSGGGTVTPPAPIPAFTGSPAPAATSPEGQVEFVWIAMIDQQNGWAIARGRGTIELVLRTADGGQTWSARTPPEALPATRGVTKTANGVFTDADQAWIVYQNEPEFDIPDPLIVWRTQDGGDTWLASPPLPLPGPPDFLDVSDFGRAITGEAFFLAHLGAGMNHDYLAVFLSASSGEDWTRVADPFETPDIQGCRKTGLDFLDGRYGWMSIDCQGVRDKPYFFSTSDGGISWDTQDLPPPVESPDLFMTSVCGVYDPHLASEQAGVVVLRCLDRADFDLQEDFLYRTADGGGTWTTFTFPGGELLVLDNEHGFALSRDIYQTADGGETWGFVKSVNWDGQFSFVDPLNGWAVARAGEALALVRTVNGGRTWQEITPALD